MPSRDDRNTRTRGRATATLEALLAEVVSCVPYWDKVEIGIRRGPGRQWLTAAEQVTLRELQAGNHFVYDTSREHAYYYRAIVILCRPTPEALGYFDSLGINHAVTYAEAKLELVTETRAAAEDVRRELARMVWHTYHGRRSAYGVGNADGVSLYFARAGNAGRSGILYVDRSKRNRGRWAAHIEVRLQRPANCRARGLGTVVDLNDETLKAVLVKEVRFRTIVDVEYAEAVIAEHFERVADGDRRRRRALGKALSARALHALAHHPWVECSPEVGVAYEVERRPWGAWRVFDAPSRWSQVPVLVLQEALPRSIFTRITTEIASELLLGGAH